MRKLICTLFLASFAAVGHAQISTFTPVDTPESQVLTQLMAVTSHETIKNKVAQILQHQEKALTPQCTQLKGARPVEINVLTPPTFNDNGAPVTGHWVVRYEVDVCDQQPLRSVGFKANGQSIDMSPLLPGNTKADPDLQADAIKACKISALKRFPECPTPFVADTRLLKLPENGDAPWEELWVVNSCNEVYPQTIRFVPQENGTIFSVDVPKE